jgi:hypothetical protein
MLCKYSRVDVNGIQERRDVLHGKEMMGVAP